MIPAPLHWWLAYAKWWANFWSAVLGDQPYPGCARPRPEPRAMTAPVERASDWDSERRGGEVVEFRRDGRL